MFFPNKLIPGLTSKATTNVTSLPVLEFHINGYKWYILLVLVWFLFCIMFWDWFLLCQLFILFFLGEWILFIFYLIILYLFIEVQLINLRVPWTARRSSQSILKEINPEYSMEGLMMKLKLQHFGHLMWRANSLEMTLMLGKIEGKKRRGQQRMRWSDSITN